MPSLTLSFRRADVAGFWIVGTAAASAACLAAAVAAGARTPWAWGAGCAAAMLVPGVLHRQWFEDGVRVWNGVMLRTSAVLRTYVSAVCYYTLVAAVARAGSALDLFRDAPRSSRWIGRIDDFPLAERQTADFLGGSELYQGLSTFTGAAAYRWVSCLFPLVLLLKMLGDEHQDTAPPTSTYTLY